MMTESKTKKIALLSTGGMLETAIKVYENLKEQGIESSVYSFHTVKPIDIDALRKIFKEYEYVASLEEHSIIGGFASAILESLVGVSGVKLEKYLPFALPSEFTSKVGDQNYLRDVYGISPEKIFGKLINKIKVEV
jgi:transketolase